MSSPVVPYPERDVLLDRETSDRAERSDMFEMFNGEDELAQGDAIQLMQRLRAMSIESTAELKRCIDAYGWPDPECHSREIVSAILYLSQHVEGQDAVQRGAIDLAQAALDADTISVDTYAQVVDQLYLGLRGRQEFGTQFHMKDGNLLLRPVRDRDSVEARRSELGLSTLTAQRERTEVQFRKMMAHT